MLICYRILLKTKYYNCVGFTDKFSKDTPKHPVRLIYENKDARPKFL